MTRSEGHEGWLQGAGRAVVGLTAAALAGSLLLLAAVSHDVPGVFREEMLAQTVMVLAYGVPGGWLLLRVPRHPAGWMLMSAAVALVLNSLGAGWAVYASGVHRDLPLAAAGMVLMRLAALSDVGVPLLLLLFPDGRLPSSGWRPVAIAVVVSALLLTLASVTVPLQYVFADAAPGEVPSALRTVPDLTGLTGLPGAVWDVVLPAVLVLDLVALVVAVASLVARYRRADETTTAQLRWFAVGGLAMVVGVIVSRLTPAPVGMVVSAVATLVLAGTIVVAVLRYRLGDAQLALNRSFVYLLLTGLVVGLYAAVVAAVTVVLGGGAAPWFAAAVVAVAFAPLRTRLQDLVNRWLRGDRTDPYRVVSTLSRRLESSHDPAEVLRATVETLSTAFRATWVRIEVPGEETIVAESGTPTPSALQLPLDAHGDHAGSLQLALPRGGYPSDRDLMLITDLVRHATAVVQAVSTTRSLQEARAELVAAREEERRRLRRDLHDGLGPQLAGLTLKLDAIRNLMRHDPDRALDLVAAAKSDAREAVDDVRRLVHDLRPPALDQVGLVGALEQHASRFRQGATQGEGPAGFDLVIQAPACLGELPAAVEVAAYRIVSEALTNVARHAAARRCEVRLERLDGSHLDLTITDDGRGLPCERRHGVGLSSMRERAAEVGGRCDVATGEHGGTVVTARLPMEPT
jgi:signal transduction histidine kinase